MEKQHSPEEQQHSPEEQQHSPEEQELAGDRRFDGRAPADHLLDRVVFGTAGLVVTVAEALPDLADKGRRRVGGQVASARVIGRFAMQSGRAELARRMAHLLGERHTPARGPGPDAGAAPEAVSGEVTAREASDQEPADAPARDRGPLVADLAIPGYDTLSASQVVQRLGGLSAAELDGIRRYELGHRNRRTILSRADQLARARDR